MEVSKRGLVVHSNLPQLQLLREHFTHFRVTSSMYLMGLITAFMESVMFYTSDETADFYFNHVCQECPQISRGNATSLEIRKHLEALLIDDNLAYFDELICNPAFSAYLIQLEEAIFQKYSRVYGLGTIDRASAVALGLHCHLITLNVQGSGISVREDGQTGNLKIFRLKHQNSEYFLYPSVDKYPHIQASTLNDAASTLNVRRSSHSEPSVISLPRRRPDDQPRVQPLLRSFENRENRTSNYISPSRGPPLAIPNKPPRRPGAPNRLQQSSNRPGQAVARNRINTSVRVRRNRNQTNPQPQVQNSTKHVTLPVLISAVTGCVLCILILINQFS